MKKYIQNISFCFIVFFVTSLHASEHRFCCFSKVVLDRQTGIVAGTDNNNREWFLTQDGKLLLYGNNAFYFQNNERQLCKLSNLNQQPKKQAVREDMRQGMIYKQFANQIRIALGREREKVLLIDNKMHVS